MEVDPDGSLCRITSSAKDLYNNLKIVKAPDDQLNKSEPLYKLVMIGTETNKSESDKSDEEFSDDDIDIQLPLKHLEKEKDTDSKADKIVEVNKPQNEEHVEKHDNNNKNNNNNKKNTSSRYRSIHNQNRYNSAKRNFNASGILTKHYKKTIPTASKNEENNCKYASSKRDFVTPCNPVRNYNSSISNTSVEPWITPPVMMNTVPSYQYSHYPQYGTYGTMEHIEQISPNSILDNSFPTGLLGDSPFSPIPTSFQSINQSDNFVHNPYWNNDYHDYSLGSFQGPGHANVSSSRTNYYQRKRNWKYRNRQKSTWNKKQLMSGKVRRNISGHFDCRN